MEKKFEELQESNEVIVKLIDSDNESEASYDASTLDSENSLRTAIEGISEFCARYCKVRML
jgi:hypothetical protein